MVEQQPRGPANGRIEREDYASVDIGFRVAERDRRVAAMALAGGTPTGSSFTLAPDRARGVACSIRRRRVHFDEHGFGAWAAAAVASRTRSSDGSEWWLPLVGAWLVSDWYTCTKALVLAHAAVWQLHPRESKAHRSSLSSTASRSVIAAVAVARWLRRRLGAGVAATLW
jgi:hypothetical protein